MMAHPIRALENCRRRDDAPQSLAAEALFAVSRFADWLDVQGPLSWDQYDFWASPSGRRAKAVYYRRGAVSLPLIAPFVLADTLAPSSRALAWHQTRFPIADAHFALGFCLLARLDRTRWLSRAVPFLEALVEERCAGEADYCWGYPFDWETCFGTWPAGTPLITSTPYGYEAFEAAHSLTGSQEACAIMESVGRFAFGRIHATEVAPGVKAATYSPVDSRRVVNASSYRGYVLAAAGSRFGHVDWVAEARAALRFVLWSQRPDGSWFYAMDGKDAFIDNFHTCFVLKNLFKAWRALGDDDLLAATRRGYDFYKQRLLDTNGLPIPFARAQRLTVQRRELYDYAEGITVGLLLADVDGDALGIAQNLASDLLQHWVLRDGSFVTRETIVGRNTVRYHRWAQSQTFRALADLAVFGAA